LFRNIVKGSKHVPDTTKTLLPEAENYTWREEHRIAVLQSSGGQASRPKGNHGLSFFLLSFSKN
jgi:hypothetical protein